MLQKYEEGTRWFLLSKFETKAEGPPEMARSETRPSNVPRLQGSFCLSSARPTTFRPRNLELG